jgi:2-amino-4-hydroxy-6-hydroxymethyldihydropteridine diphosphokinase
MALIIATGSNQGDSQNLLQLAKELLQKKLTLVAESRVYKSGAVDVTDQPDFFNQVLQFDLPPLSPVEVMNFLLETEKKMGRQRLVPRGPRTIDIDMIFWNLDVFNSEHLTIPHPRWMERSFIIRPLSELPFFQTIEKCFTIPKSFNVEAFPV